MRGEGHGNFGLMDQAAAMQWGHKFGKFFGGDLDNVSLNGCSAGSESILWHLVLPTSWPYFHRVVTVGVGLNSAYEEDLGTAEIDLIDF